jgi:hypothetical protein
VTLKILKVLTTELGAKLQHFAKLTEKLDIHETPQEYAQRKRQMEAGRVTLMLKCKPQTGYTCCNPANPNDTTNTTLQVGDQSESGRRQCTLNLNTYKMHTLGDYVQTIEEYGTTNSYSTQIVSIFL